MGNPYTRIDCGYAGIHQDVCLQRGCCWNNSNPDMLQCFFPKDPTAEEPPKTADERQLNCEDLDPSQRVECGYPGIDATVCLQRNCCWGVSIFNIPWCYHKIGYSTRAEDIQVSVQPLMSRCNIPAKLRRRCSDQYVGGGVNNRRKCIANDGCCWRRSRVYGVPWCYIARTSGTINSQSLVGGQNTGVSSSLTKRKPVYHRQFIIVIVIMVHVE